MNPSSSFHQSGFLARAFPTPAYLAMPGVGIDVSDYSIKHVLLGVHRGERVLRSYGRVDLPSGVVEHGEVKDAATLTKLLTRVRVGARYRYAHLALPEEHAYLFQIDLPRGSRTELSQMLEFHLKENVPFGADEAVFDFDIAAVAGDTYTLNVSVYPLSIAEQYMSVLEAAGYTILSVEIEGQATARALLGSDHTEPTLIIDLGRNEASLSISTKGAVTFTANLENGGDFLTRAIARGLDLSFQEAERLKREQGFRDTKACAAVFETLLPVVVSLKDSINKHLMYWHMHEAAVPGDEREVAQVILVGGNANIAGIKEYLEAELGVPVVVGDVWRNVFPPGVYVPEISEQHSLEFATAVGLALRSVG